MKLIAKYGVQLHGHVYRKGETCDWDGVISRRIADNFTDEEGAPLTFSTTDDEKVDAVANDMEKINRVVSMMKREAIVQALDDMGVTYSARASVEKLARTLLIARGEIDD